MSWMVPRLNRRIQIQKGVQVEDSGSNVYSGSFTITYETLLTVWASIREVSNWIEVIRGEAISDFPSHEFTVRWSAVGFTLGKEFGSGFTTGFDIIADIEPLKSNMFIFVEEGSSTKGRLFRVVDVRRDEKRKEYISFRCRQIEEHGTGAPE